MKCTERHLINRVHWTAVTHAVDTFCLFRDIISRPTRCRRLRWLIGLFMHGKLWAPSLACLHHAVHIVNAHVCYVVKDARASTECRLHVSSVCRVCFISAGTGRMANLHQASTVQKWNLADWKPNVIYRWKALANCPQADSRWLVKVPPWRPTPEYTRVHQRCADTDPSADADADTP